MQSAYDVKLSNIFRPVFPGDVKGFLQRHCVSAGCVRLAPKSAQAAAGHANICGIEVAVDIEMRALPVQFLTSVIGKVADGKQVIRPAESHTLVKGQALSRQDLFRNWPERRIFQPQSICRCPISLVHKAHTHHSTRDGERCQD